MDLLDFCDCDLYFEAPLPERVGELIAEASDRYGEPAAETALLRAYLIAPDNLSVLVGLYRYYYYQHRLDDALQVAERAMQLSGRNLGLPDDWQCLDEGWLARAASRSFGLLRFYLMALKAGGIVLLRLGRIAESRGRLNKLSSLDSRDQLGAGKLLAVLDAFRSGEDDGADSTIQLAVA
jgi:tetratricopeptide (TPR) repeat protein